MDKHNTKSFTAAADRDMDKILDAIRAPEKGFKTAYYVMHKSKDVAEGLLQLARSGEAEAVTSFIVSDAARFDTLAEKGQLKTLMETLEQLSTSQQFRVLSATESTHYGTPNATVLQDIVKSRDEEITGRLGTILRGFDHQQRVDLFSTPMASWWVTCHEQTPLMVEILSPLTQKERQSLVDKTGPGENFASIASVLFESCSDDLNAVFRGCKFPARRTVAPKV